MAAPLLTDQQIADLQKGITPDAGTPTSQTQTAPAGQTPMLPSSVVQQLTGSQQAQQPAINPDTNPQTTFGGAEGAAVNQFGANVANTIFPQQAGNIDQNAATAPAGDVGAAVNRIGMAAKNLVTGTPGAIWGMLTGMAGDIGKAGLMEAAPAISEATSIAQGKGVVATNPVDFGFGNINPLRADEKGNVDVLKSMGATLGEAGSAATDVAMLADPAMGTGKFSAVSGLNAVSNELQQKDVTPLSVLTAAGLGSAVGALFSGTLHFLGAAGSPADLAKRAGITSEITNFVTKLSPEETEYAANQFTRGVAASADPTNALNPTPFRSFANDVIRGVQRMAANITTTGKNIGERINELSGKTGTTEIPIVDLNGLKKTLGSLLTDSRIGGEIKPNGSLDLSGSIWNPAIGPGASSKGIPGVSTMEGIQNYMNGLWSYVSRAGENQTTLTDLLNHSDKVDQVFKDASTGIPTNGPANNIVRSYAGAVNDLVNQSDPGKLAVFNSTFSNLMDWFNGTEGNQAKGIEPQPGFGAPLGATTKGPGAFSAQSIIGLVQNMVKQGPDSEAATIIKGLEATGKQWNIPEFQNLENKALITHVTQSVANAGKYFVGDAEKADPTGAMLQFLQKTAPSLSHPIQTAKFVLGKLSDAAIEGIGKTPEEIKQNAMMSLFGQGEQSLASKVSTGVVKSQIPTALTKANIPSWLINEAKFSIPEAIQKGIVAIAKGMWMPSAPSTNPTQ